MNGLDYFHQLVKVITPEGVIMNPRVGAVGTGKVDTVIPRTQGDQLIAEAVNPSTDTPWEQVRQFNQCEELPRRPFAGGVGAGQY